MLEITKFKRDEERRIFIDYEALKEKKELLDDFIQNEPLINKTKFNRNNFPEEIKFNNSIEGIDDDVSEIDQLVKRLFVSVKRDKSRIINLYKGYSYILKNKNINKESLKKLYSLLSAGLLPEEDQKRMGEYYREGPVYIINGKSFEDFFKGVDPKNIDEYMNILFEYINSDNDLSDIDKFIKSQIIHCYCVYIHPYFDVNGRTSRTMAMWYLLNNEEYSYMTFNRSISFMKGKYDKSLVHLRKKGDMTPFLKYMLDAEKLELEKEYIINNLEKNRGKKLSNEDYLMLEYFLSMNGRLTMLDLIYMYNDYNTPKNKLEVLSEHIQPLIDKDILRITRPTKKFIGPDIPNQRIILNEDMLDVDRNKINLLKLEHYTKKDQD